MTMDSPSHMAKNNEAYLNLETRVFHPLLAILNTKFYSRITLLHPFTSLYKNWGKKIIESIRKMFFFWNGKWTLWMISFSYKTQNFNFFSSSFRPLVQVFGLHFVFRPCHNISSSFQPLMQVLGFHFVLDDITTSKKIWDRKWKLFARQVDTWRILRKKVWWLKTARFKKFRNKSRYLKL